uniref:Uncharacterized protein n=1 Tax=Erythrolobus australicus TaxID=1077150 RepID=A0A7S1TMV0_9RHOD
MGFVVARGCGGGSEARGRKRRRMRCCAGGAEEGGSRTAVSRRDAVSSWARMMACGAAVLGLGACGDAACAAVPTIEDYLGVRGGSVKRSGGSFLLDQSAKSAKKSAFDDTEQAAPLSTAADFRRMAEEARKVLDETRSLVLARQWDGVREKLRAPGGPVAALTASAPKRRDSAAPIADAGGAAELAQSLSEFASSVSAVVDFAFQNRVVFFNYSDRRSIEQLAKDTQALEMLDISEPLSDLALCDDILAEILAALNRDPALRKQ